ncbi:MAG TPA: three-Cys-motif partner protein TcmP [Candidatus Sulfotelmatobacter sp.]|nr:three-Cys-motif partner protein TcmP [Candidatus Sulfotelmatobacter sp.]
MTYQTEFGGGWTQQKLEVLRKYLQAYTTIFKKNPQARFYSISYVDAFAGTGTLRRPALGALAKFLPELQENEKEFRKGSVTRALEVEPSFDKYLLIEKDAKQCGELESITAQFAGRRKAHVLNEDANSALLDWCKSLDTIHERAVVFLDPFGASVKWETIAALGRTRAVDLWVLFPYFAINRMLVRNRRPPKAWADRLTSVFGTPEWEDTFYSTTSFGSLLDSGSVESVHKSADHRVITDFFVRRLSRAFVAVSNPFPMHNSHGALLFILFFAAANEHSAKTGLKIANDIIGKIDRS